MEVTHDRSQHRFTISLGGAAALLTYQEQGDTIYFTHTEVPAPMEGKGIGGKLAKAGLEYARQKGLKVVARCPFVSSYIERHPEYQRLLGDG